MTKQKIALYHRVMRRENFEKAAKDLFGLIQLAQSKNPNEPRALYVDIDGHRNENRSFDDDMFELQSEFGLEYLLQFCTEIHFPLISVTNPKEQCNDIPQKLKIFNSKSKQDNSLNELYIENYSNTEFMSEPEVFNYMKKVSDFLKEYNDLNLYYALQEKEDYDKDGWMNIWRNHMKDLIIELYNAFIYGNLISATAMTRSLIECYVYIKILITEKNPQLIEEWFLCSSMQKIKNLNENPNLIKNLVEDYCKNHEINFEEKWNFYSKSNNNSWLNTIISKKHISFRTACDYINEPEIYVDFQNTSPFVHFQDIENKINPFLFYETIYCKLSTMMIYMFKTIRLFPLESDMDNKIEKLESELLTLGDTFFNKNE